MKFRIKITLVFITVLSLFSCQKTFSQCFQIESVLVAACVTPLPAPNDEGLNEMVRFQVGSSPLNTNNLNVSWPVATALWKGVIQNATSAAKVAQLNADILAAGGGGKLLEPPGGIVPAGGTVILVSSYNMNTVSNSFGALADTIYIIFQNNPATVSGHISNTKDGTLNMSFSGAGGCSDSVNIVASKLVDNSLGKTAGAIVNYTPTGAATYVNYGCVAPVAIFTVDAGTTPISGCPGSKVSLSGNAVGQQSVAWSANPIGGVFSAGTSLSTDYTIPVGATGTIVLTLTATNAAGTNISDTVTLNIGSGALTITNPASVCSPATVDITSPAVTAGSTGGGTLTYWTNATATSTLTTPTAITASGTYYIKTTVGTCIDIKPVVVTVNTSPVLTITNPVSVCSPATVDITSPAVTAGSTGGGTLTYWTNATATSTLTTPTAIATSGTYYIKTTVGTCVNIKPVVVTVNNSPVLTITNPASVCFPATVDITSPAVTSGSTGGGTLTYWTNAAATNTLTTPTAIATSGTYYIKSTVGTCTDIKPVVVTVNTSPVLTITNQSIGCGVTTVDITVPGVTTGSTGGGTLTYWTNATATTAQASPNAVGAGTYYIKSTSGTCFDIKPVTVSLVGGTIAPPTVVPVTYCQNSVASPLTTLSGATLNWYGTSATGGTASATAPTPSTATVGSVTYYVSQTVGTCESARAALVVNVVANTGATITIVCDPTQATTANSVFFDWNNPPGFSPKWLYTYSINGAPLVSGTANTTHLEVFGVAPGQNVTLTITSVVGFPCITVPPMTCGLPAGCPTTTTPTFNTISTLICFGSIPQALPLVSDNGITGTWSPTKVNNLQSGSYTFTPNAGQCATNKILPITVVANTGATAANFKCDPTQATTGTSLFFDWSPVAGCTGDYYSYYTKSGDPTLYYVNDKLSSYEVLNLDYNQNVTFIIYKVTGVPCFSPQSVTCVIPCPARIEPVFGINSSYCSGSAPILSKTSLNGVTGTWSPDIVTNEVKSAHYIFKPDPILFPCANTLDLPINIRENINSTFNIPPVVCQNTIAEKLVSSIDVPSIPGTWNPAEVSTVNLGTSDYTFTPTFGVCANPKTVSITVIPNLAPVFDPVADICSGATLLPLPTTSKNGIIGTWSPALDNTKTTIYTFTPKVIDVCTPKVFLTITVIPKDIPVFTPVAAICSGSALLPLPTTSDNGMTGTWSPALDNTKTTTYTFTPTAIVGQCTTTADLVITVNPKVIPTFTAVLPICSGVTLSPLPTTSINGITGTWSPALDNTATKTYTFTPTVGLCATTADLKITVNPIVIPTFAPVAAICSGTTLSPLPTTSTNLITGTWSPVLNNTATTTYAFKPTAGLCASATALEIKVNAKVIPTFTAVPDICSGTTLSPLPTTSNNGITGTWAPALDNTATKTYTFTPTTGLCATTADLKITVNPKITPTFTAVSPICSGVVLMALPTTSNNGITGTWSPALDNTATTKYTFTPTAGLCAIPVDLTITVNPIVTPVFSPVSPICAGTVFTLPVSSTNGITGTWSPAFDNAVSKTYTFIPDLGQCVSATPIKLVITVISLPVASATPSVQSICSGDTSAIALTSSIAGTIFDWTSVQTSVNGASSGTGTTISQTLTALGNNPGSAVYSIVPTVNGCKGLPIIATVTVNPIPVVTANTTLLPICSGSATDIALTSNVAGTTFSWTVVPKGVLGALSGSGTTIAQTIKTVGLTQGTVDYLITPKANGCVGIPITVTLTVNPTPEVFGSTGTTICSGETTSISLSPNIPGTTFAWTVLPTGVIGAVDGSGDVINQTLEADTVPGKAIYTITPSLNGCDGKSINVTINVNAAPVPAITDGIICAEQVTNTTFKSYTLSTGLSNSNFDFEWFLGGVLIDGAVSSSYEAKIAGSYSVIVTNTSTGCVSKEVTATVVTNYPADNPFLATVTDAFTQNSVITIAVTGGTGPFLYQLDLGALQSENVFMGASSGFHNVKVTDPQGCTNMSQPVTVIDYPKYFTPNGDGINDTWNIGSLNDPTASIFIYDRYGKLIKQISASNGMGWDGTYNGKQLPSTDYWFTLNYFESNTNKSFKAHFTLKR
ncbi:T9SS type B sorting domain-containing protein [Flavobacterium psychrotolerans]|uniref:Ig-like domain-containing protein n=1 Tax=Flavobacterium psychrotolerans TaxID=2169410 RepID=A0A2U1JG61_9FLAO|nr:T9SS type B sorting domain-containing protein [Flavobacterium psychrotolerans]PWA03989.1 hypothetical protein DB895_13180 [Flavobacterium psychrotolerans]